MSTGFKDSSHVNTSDIITPKLRGREIVGNLVTLHIGGVKESILIVFEVQAIVGRIVFRLIIGPFLITGINESDEIIMVGTPFQELVDFLSRHRDLAVASVTIVGKINGLAGIKIFSGNGKSG